MTEAPSKAPARQPQPRKSQSWIGYRVKSFQALTRGDGAVFAEGTEFTVISVFRGLTLADDSGRLIRRVPKEWVRVLSSGVRTTASSAIGKTEE